jgi:hypothetical protein
MLLKKRFTIHLKKKKLMLLFQIPNYYHSVIKLSYSLLVIVDFGYSNIYNLGLCQICSGLEKFLPTHAFINNSMSIRNYQDLCQRFTPVN